MTNLELLCSKLSATQIDPWNVVIIITEEVNTVLNYKELPEFTRALCGYAWQLL